MAWKIERWFAEVFPGETQIYAEYHSLPPRELAIVSAAVLDVALAELLARRLIDQTKEVEEFLGANGDGRAPAGSFGARIQLGLLVGLLTPDDAAILRNIKELRNLFAHRVRINFLSPDVLKSTTKLYDLWVRRSAALAKAGAMSGTTEKLAEIGHFLPRVAEAGEGLLLSVFMVYQAYFHLMHSRVQRLGSALVRTSEPRNAAPH